MTPLGYLVDRAGQAGQAGSRRVKQTGQAASVVNDRRYRVAATAAVKGLGDPTWSIEQVKQVKQGQAGSSRHRSSRHRSSSVCRHDRRYHVAATAAVKGLGDPTWSIEQVKQVKQGQAGSSRQVKQLVSCVRHNASQEDAPRASASFGHELHEPPAARGCFGARASLPLQAFAVLARAQHSTRLRALARQRAGQADTGGLQELG